MPDHPNPGDRYLRLGNPSAIWMEERLIDHFGQPLHVRLVEEGHKRSITIAVSVLADERQFRQIEVGE